MVISSQYTALTPLTPSLHTVHAQSGAISNYVAQKTRIAHLKQFICSHAVLL